MNEVLKQMNKIGLLERLFVNSDRPEYHYTGGILNWDDDLSEDVKIRLQNAEMFIVNDEAGKPFKYIFKDVYGILREKLV